MDGQRAVITGGKAFTFGHLHPLDLLHIAWTSKGLRKIVMSRSSATIWRRSLSTVEKLPDCLVGMNEPQYARLMFDEICHFCDAGNAKHVIFLARLRCCKACGLEKFESLSGLPEDVARPVFSITPYTRIDWARGYMGGVKYYYIKEMHRLQAEYCRIRHPTLKSAWVSMKEQDFRAMEKFNANFWSPKEGSVGS
ncbi:hypothetical protein CPB84DRAFT_1751043 [Gymnopilus junonius]|uniref:Uncharacterized protein n=1 Tax=Gymnopilus junonius TaxID=109634 RepID=A0A9P5NCH1_GYMJU|nr:hypothetical protein CPB84DRAFT_1751043 [Gymnopilus junonius]